MNNKEKYRNLCQEEHIPLFSQAWWLDAVCGYDNWDVCLIEKGGQVMASMPYFVRRAYGFDMIQQPPLTQNSGPWIRPSKAKYAKRLGQEKDLMQALIAELPKYDYFIQNWHHSKQNWLPFYWAGFKQTTRYTYILENLEKLDDVWSGLQANIRTDIRKATDKFNLVVRDDISMERFIDLNKATFARQGLSLPYSTEFAKNIERQTSKRNNSKVFVAEDKEGRLHAGVFIVWDEHSAYYLMSGGDPELRNSGATSLLLWHSIQFASTVTKQFDFEGSMIEPVERFCRGFGAIQTPYFSISKSQSRFLPLLMKIKSLTG